MATAQNAIQLQNKHVREEEIKTSQNCLIPKDHHVVFKSEGEKKVTCRTQQKDPCHLYKQGALPPANENS